MLVGGSLPFTGWNAGTFLEDTTAGFYLLVDLVTGFDYNFFYCKEGLLI